VSWLNAVVVPFWTITGKPNDVATRLAFAGIAETMQARATTAKIAKYFVLINLPSSEHMVTSALANTLVTI
jgi:hypothetical protein